MLPAGDHANKKRQKEKQKQSLASQEGQEMWGRGHPLLLLPRLQFQYVFLLVFLGS